MPIFYDVYEGNKECDACRKTVNKTYGMGGPETHGDVIAYCFNCLLKNGGEPVRAHQDAGHIPPAVTQTRKKTKKRT